MKSKYKYVYYCKRDSYWLANVSRTNKVKGTRFLIRKWFKSEKEAAKAVDLALIKNGEEPVNILKKLNK